MSTSVDNKNVDKMYQDMVVDCIKTNSTFRFGNESAAHAAFIFSELLKNAKQSIRIVSGSAAESFLTGVTFPEVCEALKTAAKTLADNCGSIKIITINDQSSDKLANFIDKLNTELGQNIIEYRPAKYSGGDDEIQHAFVADTKRYRLEFPHKKFEVMSHDCAAKATVCMNDPSTARYLEDYFDDIWRQMTTAA